MAAMDESSPYERLRNDLCSLGLDEMAASLPEYMRLVASGDRDFCGALGEMAAAEVARKEARDLARRIRAAGFPYVKGLDGFDFSFQPSLPRPVVEELATLRFLEAGENVLLVGSPGVGKTHLAIALGVAAVKARKEVRFVDCARLVEDLRDASRRGALGRRIKFYAHSTLLIVDELGYLDVDDEAAAMLFQLVSARYERRSTIVTTNVPVSGWAEVFGSAVTASAIADRLCHHCTHLRITGRSYPMRELAAEMATSREDGAPGLA